MGKTNQFDSYYDAITKRTAENIQVLCRRLEASDSKFRFCHFERESQLEELRDMIKSELSEPYTIFTYRFFVYERPELCILAYYGEDLIGVIIGRVNVRNPDDEGLGVTAATLPEATVPANGDDDSQTHMPMSGYIAMIAVKSEYRRKNIGTMLVLMEVEQCLRLQCDEVFLETEVNNVNALRLYQKLGFFRQTRLKKYYQNGNDAYRLKLWLRPPPYILGALDYHKPMSAQCNDNHSMTISHIIQNLLGNASGSFEAGNSRRSRTALNETTGNDSSSETKSNPVGQSDNQSKMPPYILKNGAFNESYFKLPVDLQDLLKRP